MHLQEIYLDVRRGRFIEGSLRRSAHEGYRLRRRYTLPPLPRKTLLSAGSMRSLLVLRKSYRRNRDNIVTNSMPVTMTYDGLASHSHSDLDN